MISQSKIIDNIYSVAKEKGRLIKDLENVAGLSVGYLSRMRDGDGGPRLSADVMLKICAELGVSVDALLNYDGGMTENERKLVDFVTKLTEDTNRDLLKWNFHPKEKYSRDYKPGQSAPLYANEVQYSRENSHYLTKFNDRKEFESVLVDKGVYVASLPNSEQDVNVILSSTCYILNMENGVGVVYHGYELYFATCNEYKQICNAIKSRKEKMLVILRNLFVSAQESQNRIYLDDESNYIIDGYLHKDDAVTFDETIPF